jgi:hypothetical protein
LLWNRLRHWVIPRTHVGILQIMITTRLFHLYIWRKAAEAFLPPLSAAHCAIPLTNILLLPPNQLFTQSS